MNRAMCATWALLSAAACGSGRSAPLAPATFVYRDTSCGLLPNGLATCADVGDGLTYRLCSSDDDCSPDAPFCRILGLFQSGNFNCNGQVVICRQVDRNDCRH
jgi:hypothetical protein